jgi:hypothetical protein
MEKITLKLFEFYNLDVEINGMVNPQTQEKTTLGLLNEKLSLVTKYWLTDVGKKVAQEKNSIEELKNELIKKYGTEVDGNISIPIMVNELDAKNQKVYESDGTTEKFVVNPVYFNFEREYAELLETEKELEYHPFSLSDFLNVETSENYLTFFKLISA